MRILVVRPPFKLSKTTAAGYRNMSDDVRFMMRERNLLYPQSSLYNDYDLVVNLGNNEINKKGLETIMVNDPDRVAKVTISPRKTRKLFTEFWPHVLWGRDFVVKRAGSRKGLQHKLEHSFDLKRVVLGHEDAIQMYVPGDEYRVVIVCGKIVQASRKHGSFGDFDYEWVGVQHLRDIGVLDWCRAVAERCVNVFGKWHLLGMDMIISQDQPYLIELNSCPGVNEHTGRRVGAMLERFWREETGHAD